MYKVTATRSGLFTCLANYREDTAARLLLRSSCLQPARTNGAVGYEKHNSNWNACAPRSAIPTLRNDQRYVIVLLVRTEAPYILDNCSEQILRR